MIACSSLLDIAFRGAHGLIGFAQTDQPRMARVRYMGHLAHLESAFAAPGTAVKMEVTVEHRRRQADAKVVKTPFFDPPRKRA